MHYQRYLINLSSDPKSNYILVGLSVTRREKEQKNEMARLVLEFRSLHFLAMLLPCGPFPLLDDPSKPIPSDGSLMIWHGLI